MLNSKTSNKRGPRKSAFTLIELSIVLIIIGLLVAGVTGGASLIRSAQLRSMMSEVRGYSVAVNAFRVQYDNLPGDYGTAINAPVGVAGTFNSGAGDQDGKIEYIAGQGTFSIREGVNAWFHLINSGIIDNKLTLNFSITASNGTWLPIQVVGTNMPASKLDGVGFAFANTAAGNVLVATGDIDTGLFAITTNHAIENQQFVSTGAIAPTDALSIDTKLDDGVANAGKVRAYSSLWVPGDCFNGTAYITATKNKTCALEFTVDIS